MVDTKGFTLPVKYDTESRIFFFLFVRVIVEELISVVVRWSNR